MYNPLPPRLAIVFCLLATLALVLGYRGFIGSDSASVDFSRVSIEASDYQTRINARITFRPKPVRFPKMDLGWDQEDYVPEPISSKLGQTWAAVREISVQGPFCSNAPLLGGGLDIRTYYVLFFPMPLVVVILLTQPLGLLIVRYRRARRGPGFCSVCGYDVRGIVANCPECGSEIDPRLGAELKRRFARTERRYLYIIVGLKALALFLSLCVMDGFHIKTNYPWWISIIASAPLFYPFTELPAPNPSSVLIYLICQAINCLVLSCLLALATIAAASKIGPRDATL